jgi:SAM-dependent methyltransferase/protein tyrosine phosphatase (PTP) superfamily phosphohydrolase (DUF442 family)
MYKLNLAYLFAVLSLTMTSMTSAQQTATPIQEAANVESTQLGTTKNVHRVGDIYTAGQFSESDIEVLKSNKIGRIITLRTDGEIDWEEGAKVKAAGIEFVEIPFRAPETLTDDVFDKVRELLRDESKPTLFHCGSASRVGGTWLPFRVLDQGVPLEIAANEAKEIGLKTPFIREKALDYIRRKMAETPVEKSVKPGINKSFLDPALDVDQFIKRFEVESREVFMARNKIVSGLGIKAGDTVADIGSGTGLFTRMFSKSTGGDGWVYAVDISPRFLEHVNRQSVDYSHQNVTGVLCSENSVKLPHNSVDVAFICDTYHHFEFPQSTMKSIHRSLKPNGRLIVIDFERIPGQTREWLLDHVRAGKEVFRAEIQDAGFTLVEEKKIEGFKENYFLVFKKD